MQKKKGQLQLILPIVALGLASFLIGMVIRKNKINNEVFIIALGVIAALIFILFITNAIIIKHIRNKRFDRKSTDDKMFKMKKLCEENVNKYYRHIYRLICLSNLYFGFVIFLFMAMYSLIIILLDFVFVALYLVAGVFLYFILRNFALIKIGDDFKEYEITKNEFPKLWEMIDDTLKNFTINKKVKCYAIRDNNAAVLEQQDTIKLFIGIPLFQNLSEEELRNVLIHELLHIELKHTSNAYKIERKLAKFENIDVDSLNPFDKFVTTLILPMTFAMHFEVEVYRVVSQSVRENEVDRIVKERGSAKDYINGLAKIELYNLFEMNDSISTISLYESESPTEDYFIIVNDSFRKAYYENKEFWENLLPKQLPKRIDTHSHFKRRMELLDINSFEVKFDNYIPEKEQLVSKFGKIYANNFDKKYYSEYRKREYLENLEYIENYEKGEYQDKPLYKYFTAYAYRVFGNLNRSLEIYDELLKSNPNSGKLLFNKGYLLLRMYNNEGINLIYQAMNSHKQYLETGCVVIAQYALKMGLQDEVDKIRKYRDENWEYVINVHFRKAITPYDKYIKTKLTPEVVSDIIMHLSKDERISRIMIVDKKINKKDFVSIVGIEIVPKYQDQVGDIMDNVYDYLFDERNEEYMLICLSMNPYYMYKFMSIKNAIKLSR